MPVSRPTVRNHGGRAILFPLSSEPASGLPPAPVREVEPVCFFCGGPIVFGPDVPVVFGDDIAHSDCYYEHAQDEGV